MENLSTGALDPDRATTWASRRRTRRASTPTRTASRPVTVRSTHAMKPTLSRGLATPVPPDDPAHPLPALLDRRLGTERGRLVVLGVQDHVRCVLLLGDPERRVVAVGVGLPVPQRLRAAVVGIAQVRGHRPDLAGAHVG